MASLNPTRTERVLALVKATMELEALGWFRVRCEQCKGTGLSDPSPDATHTFDCMYCGGDGYNWHAPESTTPWCKPIHKPNQEAAQ